MRYIDPVPEIRNIFFVLLRIIISFIQYISDTCTAVMLKWNNIQSASPEIKSLPLIC